MKRFALAALFVALAGQAHAFSDDEARRAILDLRQESRTETGRLQIQIDRQQQTQIQLSNRLEQLLEQNRELTGRIEELTNRLQRMDKAASARYKDLDERIARFEPVKVDYDGRTVEVDPKEKKAYDEAMAALQAGSYAEAADKFGAFNDVWRTSVYRPDTIYLYGLSLFGAERFKDAIAAQDAYLRIYPKGEHAADAMLNVGGSQAALGNLKAARATFTKLLKLYPKSPAAETAKARIKELGKK